MEEKSNLYIVAVVSIIAVVAMVFMATSVGEKQSFVTMPSGTATASGSTAGTDDSAGQAMQVLNSNANVDSGTITSGTTSSNTGVVVNGVTIVCTASDPAENPYIKGNVILTYIYKGSTSLTQNYYDFCVKKDLPGDVIPTGGSCSTDASFNCYAAQQYCFDEYHDGRKFFGNTPQLVLCKKGCSDGACLK